jgi:hypothetical protein
MKYSIDQNVKFWGNTVTIKDFDEGKNEYYCCFSPYLSVWLKEQWLVGYNNDSAWGSERSLLVIDDFYKDPDTVREIALNQEYESNIAHYKGLRTRERFLWPYLKEQFETLLQKRITDWLLQPANGCFQKTESLDPLVWHSDTQDYAAAVYLTPEAPVSAGTSFWRDKKHLCRRPPFNSYEAKKFGDLNEAQNAYSEIYSKFNIVNPDNWELVDRIGCIYNRLVIWDAQLIHSASSYEGMSVLNPRLVQLFFFSVEK